MKVDLSIVKAIIEEAMELPNTGHAKLEEELADYNVLVGHTNPYYRTFWLLGKRLQPSVTVELGAYRGNSSAAFAIGCPTANVVTIDIHREDKIAQQKCRDWQKCIPNFEYINAWSWDAAPAVAAYPPIDILYIDAWHEYKYAIREWKLYESMLADEALVICDDIFDSVGTTEGMLKFWDEVSGPYEHFIDTTGHSGIQMGYMRYLRE